MHPCESKTINFEGGNTRMCHNLQISINIQIRKFVYNDVGSTKCRPLWRRCAKCRVLFWRMKVVGADLERSCFKRKAILLFGSRHLACWKTSQPLLATNKLRSCQTIFLSWMTCFHQNKILIGEQNLFL